MSGYVWLSSYTGRHGLCAAPALGRRLLGFCVDEYAPWPALEHDNHPVPKTGKAPPPPLVSPPLFRDVSPLPLPCIERGILYKANILSYMFLKNHFAFLDFEKSTITIFIEHTAMMELWVCAAIIPPKP
jgi:hypothetical protein